LAIPYVNIAVTVSGETCLHLALSSPAEARTEIINYLVNCCGANINLEVIV